MYHGVDQDKNREFFMKFGNMEFVVWVEWQKWEPD